ncbi:MAG: hypothetical protein U0930_01935 [Pirellulales bacterium]
MSDKETNYVVNLKRDEDNSPFSSIADFFGSELRLESISSDHNFIQSESYAMGQLVLNYRSNTDFLRPPSTDFREPTARPFTTSA